MAGVGFKTVWRHLWGAVFLTLTVSLFAPERALAAPARSLAAPDVPVPPENLLIDRGNGPISAADKDFVIRVRLAGLWEIPAGEMAQEKSGSNRVKKIGRSIADQHGVLDQLARDAAKKLKVALPNEPNEAQQGWLDEMEAADGADFDAIYIDRLRAAHGAIFPAVATIRAGTRNDTVRKLAQQTNQFVMTHMTLLESSELVDFGALPTVPPPAAATGSKKAPEREPEEAPDQVLSAAEQASGSSLSGSSMPLIAAALAGGLAVGIFATRQILGNRRQGFRSRRPRYYGG